MIVDVVRVFNVGLSVHTCIPGSGRAHECRAAAAKCIHMVKTEAACRLVAD